MSVLGWPEAFAIGVAIVTIGKGVVTLRQDATSKNEMSQPPPQPIQVVSLSDAKMIVDSINDIRENYEEIIVSIARIEGMQAKFNSETTELKRRFELDHKTLGLVKEAITLGIGRLSGKSKPMDTED